MRLLKFLPIQNSALSNAVGCVGDRMQVDVFQGLCDDSCANPQWRMSSTLCLYIVPPTPKAKIISLASNSERQGVHQFVMLMLFLCKLLKMSGVRGVSPLY